MSIVLYGPAYSVYVRIVRVVLEEKGVDYDLQPFDIFGGEDWPAGLNQPHPFQRVPVFEHDGFVLYETQAITRYIDEAFAGPLLQPRDTKRRARMNQIIGVLDNYVYWPLVREIYVQRCRDETDEGIIAEARPKAERALDALGTLIDDKEFLAGETFSLADAQAVPMFDYFLQTPEGRDFMACRPNLGAWWQRVCARPSVQAMST